MNIFWLGYSPVRRMNVVLPALACVCQLVGEGAAPACSVHLVPARCPNRTGGNCGARRGTIARSQPTGLRSGRQVPPALPPEAVRHL